MNDQMTTNNTSYGLYSLSGAIIAAAVLSFVAFFLFLTRMDMTLRISAIEQCGKLSYSQQNLDGKSIVKYPLADFYTKCLDKAGVK